MSDKREFTGVFIPAHIWVSKELIPAEKMILGEIDALSKARGYCDASRKHFAEWLSCTVQNVSFYFSKLEQLGFIKIEKIPGYRSKIRLINDRFYQDEGVNGTDGGGKRGLPEIQDKRKGLNASLNESSAPEKFDGNETDSNFKKIGAIEINENPVSVNIGKTEQDAPGGRPTRAEYEKAVNEYFEADKPQEAIRSDDPNPVETATQIAVDFMQRNAYTVQMWCENARWSGTPQDLVKEFREFFSYYQSTSPEHLSITRPEFWFKTKFPGWISKAKNFKNGTANTNSSAEQLANDSLRRALEYAQQAGQFGGSTGY